jgi:hypothetical protein
VRVVLVHYHLRPGGVSAVLRHQALALRAAGWDPLVATGEAPPDPSSWRGIRWQRLPGLGYRAASPAGPSPRRLAAALAALAEGGVVHFHNPTLGKNPGWAQLINTLHTDNHPLVLQVHDFAEDGRLASGQAPPGWAAGYPGGGRCAWVVLNPRDGQVLRAAGVHGDRLAVVPNPVASPSWQAAPGITYPARGLRRKNLGEFLLWALVSGGRERFRITLAPRQPGQRALFRRWRALARHLRLPVDFAAAPAAGGAIAGPAPMVLSTSIQEGFGLAFAEPWLAGLAVAGRDLPEATACLRAAGWEMPDAYRRLRVPAAWVGRRKFSDAVRAAAPGRHRAVLAAAFPHLAEGWLDFGNLPEAIQAAILVRLAGDPSAARAVLAESPAGGLVPAREWWQALHRPPPPALVAANRHAIGAACAPAAVARALAAIYRELAREPAQPHGWLDPAAIRATFDDPARFHFLHPPP